MTPCSLVEMYQRFKTHLLLLHSDIELRMQHGFSVRSSITKINYYLRHVRPSVCLSTRNNSAPTRRNFVKFDIWVIFENLSKIFKFN
jgi:hypothetical protein